MAHALLGPSSGSIWMNCPPSARLTEGMADTSGIAAAEGTCAHRLCEILLMYDLGLIIKEQYLHELKLVKATVWTDPQTKEIEELYDDAMFDYATDYVSLVMTKFQEVKLIDPLAQIFPEQQFDLSAYVPEGFGTCDTCIVADGVLYVFDLKYGKGVPVSSENNKQLRMYALGAYLEFKYIFKITSISMTIVQPRIDNTSTAVIKIADLLQWADTELKVRAELAFNGGGEFFAGSHCQFCKARPVCRANAEYMNLQAIDAFKEPTLLRDEEITTVLLRKKEIEGYLKAVSDYALAKAVNEDKQWPDMKLVRGLSRSKYMNDAEVIKVLQEKSYPLSDIAKLKPIGLGEMKKLLGKNKYEEYLSTLIVKPPGKATLVHVTDDRPAISSAEDAIKAFDDEV